MVIMLIRGQAEASTDGNIPLCGVICAGLCWFTPVLPCLAACAAGCLPNIGFESMIRSKSLGFWTA